MGSNKGLRRPLLVRLEPDAWRRLLWLHQCAKNGVNGECLDRQRKISLADIINNSIMEYRRDELSAIREKKVQIAQEMAALDNIEKAIIEKNKRKQSAEMSNVFNAEPIRARVKTK